MYDAFGTEITLSFEAEKSVTLSRFNNKFRLTPGDDQLSTLGIDRVARASTEPDPDDHMLGSVLIKGVAFSVKYQYAIRLQQLTKTEYDDILLMVAAVNKSGKLLRLDDRVLPFSEYGARTRAIAPGTPAATVAGNFSTYYASFKIWVNQSEVKKVWLGPNRGQIDLIGYEYDKPLTV